jgi:hypothetical protein
LDLASGTEHPLNQVTRSVDDQVDWFDADHIVYHDSAPQGTGIWLLSIDGVSPPRLILRNAYSPAVQHASASAAAPSVTGAAAGVSE